MTLKAAAKVLTVATVQNEDNLVTRKRVLDPARGRQSRQTRIGVSRIAAQLDSKPSQVAFAWVLKQSPVMLPIPDTSKPDHLAENVAAASLQLSNKDFSALDAQARSAR